MVWLRASEVISVSEKPSLSFARPDYDYDELEAQLQAYQPDSDRYPHDAPSIVSIEEGIRAGRLGNVAVGGCLLFFWKRSVGVDARSQPVEK